MPASVIEAICYLESWGDPKAQSVTGPRGIMQISGATAATMGLRVTYATRYEDDAREGSGEGEGQGQGDLPDGHAKNAVQRYWCATTACCRSAPSPRRRTTSLEWSASSAGAIGRFCVPLRPGLCGMMQEITRRARGIPAGQDDRGAYVFSPRARHGTGELYDAMQQQMQRDYSPTYWFRIRRAEQLLALYRRDPAEFASPGAGLQERLRYKRPGSAPSPACGSKKDDLVFRSDDDIRAAMGQRLVKGIDPARLLRLRLEACAPIPDYLSEARRPSAVGTLAYIAFERRGACHEQMGAKGPFRPLLVTSLVEPGDYASQRGKPEAPVALFRSRVRYRLTSPLPPAELECLRLCSAISAGRSYLGFVEDGMDSLHIGCSPGSRGILHEGYSRKRRARRQGDMVEGGERK